MIGPPLPKQHAISRFIYARWPIDLGGKLTPIQEKILSLRHKGFKQSEIAELMDCAKGTVYQHVLCIRAKGYFI